MPAKLTKLEDARALVLERVEPLGVEPVALEQALGRVLGEALRAPFDVPGYDNSAMDGYALRAGDSGAGVRLAVVAESRAGAPADRPVGTGEACAISTGAAIPEGADAVIRVEDTERLGPELELVGGVAAGNNIRCAGEDARAGELILEAGVRLGPAEVGVLAEFGCATISAARRPRVAVVTTGDELVGIGEPLPFGAVHNSGAIVMPALVEQAGGVTVSNEHSRDEPGLVRAALARALAADVVVVCAGMSVGEHDHVAGALHELGVSRHFAGVALKPGRPTRFGSRGRTLVFGLPGNPVSSLVTFLLFVRPALFALAGARPEGRRAIASLAEAVAQEQGRAQMVRCRLELSDAGWLAHPTGPQGSHVLTSMLAAEAFAVIPAGAATLDPGARVAIELI